MQRAGAVLAESHDKYMMLVCGEPAWFVVQLSEDILITKVVLGNHEHYSSHFGNKLLFTFNNS